MSCGRFGKSFPGRRDEGTSTRPPIRARTELDFDNARPFVRLRALWRAQNACSGDRTRVHRLAFAMEHLLLKHQSRTLNNISKLMRSNAPPPPDPPDGGGLGTTGFAITVKVAVALAVPRSLVQVSM